MDPSQIRIELLEYQNVTYLTTKSHTTSLYDVDYFVTSQKLITGVNTVGMEIFGTIDTIFSLFTEWIVLFHICVILSRREFKNITIVKNKVKRRYFKSIIFKLIIRLTQSNNVCLSSRWSFVLKFFKTF